LQGSQLAGVGECFPENLEGEILFQMAVSNQVDSSRSAASQLAEQGVTGSEIQHAGPWGLIELFVRALAFLQPIRRGVPSRSRVRGRQRADIQEQMLQGVDSIGNVNSAIIVRVRRIFADRRFSIQEEERQRGLRIADVHLPVAVGVTADEYGDLVDHIDEAARERKA